MPKIKNTTVQLSGLIMTERKKRPKKADVNEGSYVHNKAKDADDAG